MPEKRRARFRVTDGKIARSAQKWIVTQIRQYEDGEHVQITIEPPKRSLAHNRYYWGQVIGPIVQAWRNAGFDDLHLVGPDGEMIKLPVTKDMVHAWFKHKYIPQVAPEKKISTTKLNENEMHQYIECIRSDQDVLDAGVFIQEGGRIYG